MSGLLTVGLAHLAPRRDDRPGNLAGLLDALQEAADAGAGLVLAPELAVAGYGFADRGEAGRAAEDPDGPTVTAVTRQCRRLGVWCAVGALERDGDALFNTAVLIGPHGVAGRHRKIVVAERRWSAVGRPSPASVVDTPWGPVGLLVCADTYYGLPARAMALRGARALLVLATWPPGGADPAQLWPARAAENGRYVLACNRTGLDGGFDARGGVSMVADPRGGVCLRHDAPQEALLLATIPLVQGRFPTLDSPLTGAFPPPPPAPDAARAAAPATVRLSTGVGVPPAASLPGEGVSLVAAPHSVDAAPPTGACPIVGADPAGAYAAGPWGLRRSERGRPLVLDVDGLRVAVTGPGGLAHPEQAVALARRGVDLVVVPTADATDEPLAQRLLLRCLERLAVAVLAPGRARLAEPPAGHEPPHVTDVAGPATLDVTVAGGYSTLTGGTWPVFDAVDEEAWCTPSAT